MVLGQEIFGVTGHVRRVCDGYASEGYHVVAPALFDRVRPGIELGYSKEDAAIGRELRSRIGWEQVFADVAAGRDHVAGGGKVAVLGYCWGGTIAWRAAAQLDGVAAAVCYYATLIGPHIGEKPRCAVLMHFGEHDPLATLTQAGNCARCTAPASRSRFIPPATDSTATRLPTITRQAQHWRCAVRLIFLRRMSDKDRCLHLLS